MRGGVTRRRLSQLTQQELLTAVRLLPADVVKQIGKRHPLLGSPAEQLLDAKTNVSPMSRRRDARRSLRADRPRGESGSDGQAAA